MSVHLLERVGVAPNLDHVSISASRDIAAVLKAGSYGTRLGCEFDVATFQDVLEQLGEFKTNKRVPLGVTLTSTPPDTDETVKGWARSIWEDGPSPRLLGRLMCVPLFRKDCEVEYSDGATAAFYDYEQNEVAATAIHETRHVVDFLDDELMREQFAYRAQHAPNPVQAVAYAHGYDSSASYLDAPIELRARQAVAEFKRPVQASQIERPGVIVVDTHLSRANKDEGLPVFIKLRDLDKGKQLEFMSAHLEGDWHS